jgi:hypothetical protein
MDSFKSKLENILKESLLSEMPYSTSLVDVDGNVVHYDYMFERFTNYQDMLSFITSIFNGEVDINQKSEKGLQIINHPKNKTINVIKDEDIQNVNALDLANDLLNGEWANTQVFGRAMMLKGVIIKKLSLSQREEEKKKVRLEIVKAMNLEGLV